MGFACDRCVQLTDPRPDPPPPSPTFFLIPQYNSGFEPICGATLALSETAEVEQAWSVEQVGLALGLGRGDSLG